MLNRQWRMLRYPEGQDFADALALETAPVADLGPGEVLIRNQWLSLDAGTRMWMTPRTDGYQPPLPPGAVVPGLVLGEVVASRHARFAEGDLVRGFGQWADLSVVTPEASDLRALDRSVPDVRQHLGVLGMNGWTAYVGVTEAGRARPGETVLVSAAAGATGMLAAQVAQRMGCRVIGVAGSAEKLRFLTQTLRLDDAIDHHDPDLATRLEAIGGVDIYFDNVGGPLLDLVLPAMAHYGRIALCGLVASYDDASTFSVERFDQILMRRLQVTGFFSPDFAARGDEINRRMRRWLDMGLITMPFEETPGLERTLDAYAKLFTGGNIGKVIVKIDF